MNPRGPPLRGYLSRMPFLARGPLFFEDGIPFAFLPHQVQYALVNVHWPTVRHQALQRKFHALISLALSIVDESRYSRGCIAQA